MVERKVIPSATIPSISNCAQTDTERLVETKI